MRMVACVAFCTVVGAAFVLAWNAFDPHLRIGTGATVPPGLVADLGTSGAVASGSAPVVEPARVLMHLSSGDRNRINEVLDEAEATARYYASQNRPSQIEVITNGDGIVLLLAASNQYSERVRALQARYPNLRFSACRNTLERYARNGLDTHLQPNVGIVESGVAEIIRRQRDGWAYLRV
jgi:intracellular sulfur oxidation DsrE/DsrF family protein